MKTFSYTWCDDYFLLHIQLNNPNGAPYEVLIKRAYDGKGMKPETVQVKAGTPSHRFLVSRTHPTEKSFTIDYPDHLVMEAFKLDDRAYYPTESFFKG